MPASQAGPELLDGVGFIVVGGPTHAHGMSRASTRGGAVEAASKPGTRLTVAPGADGRGLREWFANLGQFDAKATAFDTRVEGPAMLTGHASRRITPFTGRYGPW